MKQGEWLGLVGLMLSVSLGFSPEVIAQTLPASVNAGYSQLNRGWVKDAIATFEQAVQRYPNLVEARLGLAIAYQRAGRDADAWKAYQQVLQQSPDNVAALKAIGELAGYRPEWQTGGIMALTRLLQQTPNDRPARTQRALLYGYQAQYAEAFADYEILLANNPTPEAVLGAAQVYSYSGNYPRSRELFNRYRATGKTIPDGALASYARTLVETGEKTSAIQLLEAKLQQPKLPTWLEPDLRSVLAIAYQANNQPAQALQVLQPLRQQPQAQLPLARSLSVLARRSGNWTLLQDATALYQQVLQQTSNPSRGLLLEVADALSELPTTKPQALTIYQTLSQQQPGDRTVLVKRLVLENQLGQLSQVELQQQLQSALQPLPEFVVERQAIARALSQLDPPLAVLLPTYQTLAQPEVEVPFLNFRIAQIYLQQGDLQQAKAALAAYQAASTGVTDSGAEFLLAEIERREGNLEASAQRYTGIIARNASANEVQNALLGLASIRRSQGRLEEVVQLYDEILSREPNNVRAQLGRIQLNYQLQKISTTDAEQALEQWLSQQPQLLAVPELYDLVGALPPDPKREPLYLALLQASPGNVAVERRLIQVIALRDPAAARSRMDQVLQGDRTSIASYFLQGELAQAIGDLPLAAEAYTAILQQQPENTDALSALGGVRFQQKQYDAATKIYKQVLALKPDDLETQRVLAELYLAQDLPTRGFRQLQRVERSQQQEGINNPVVDRRLEEVKLNFLRRRGLQPSWERY